MTEQENRARFRLAVDRTLSGIEGDPFLAQRVMANARKGEQKMKYRIPRGLVIALLVLVCMGTVAVAAGLYGGTTNWLGEVVPDERVAQSMPTVAPPMETEEIDLNEDTLAQLEIEGTKLFVFEMTEDGEMLPKAGAGLKKTAQDMERFLALMDGAAYLKLPNLIPEGYEFVMGEVYYECTAEGQWDLVNRKSLGNGLYAEWYVPSYVPDENEEVVSGYYLLFRNSTDDYHYLSIYAVLSETQDLNEQRFSFLGGTTARAVSVPGMNNALAVTGENNCSLYMLGTLETPIGIRFFWDPNYQEVMTCTEVDITVSAPMLDVDTLIHMFAAE